MLASYNYSNKTSSATVVTGPGVLHSVTLAAGSDAATAIVYDNTAASGAIICKLTAPQDTNAHAVLDVAFGIGCHIALTGTSPSGTVAYG